MGSHVLDTSECHTPPRGSDGGGSCDINTIVSPPVESTGKVQGNAWVFSKGEIMPVTNNNIYSNLSLDKGN